MTEDQQSGTVPEPEATASESIQAPEETGGAVAVADDPAEPSPTEDATEAVVEPSPRPRPADARRGRRASRGRAPHRYRGIQPRPPTAEASR